MIRFANVRIEGERIDAALDRLVDEYLEDDQDYAFGIVQIASKLEDVDALTAAEAAVAREQDGLALFFANYDGPIFFDIKNATPELRYFVEGLERQADRVCIFVGYRAIALDGRAGCCWMEVPAKIEDRWGDSR